MLLFSVRCKIYLIPIERRQPAGALCFASWLWVLPPPPFPEPGALENKEEWMGHCYRQLLFQAGTIFPFPLKPRFPLALPVLELAGPRTHIIRGCTGWGPRVRGPVRLVERQGSRGEAALQKLRFFPLQFSSAGCRYLLWGAFGLCCYCCYFQEQPGTARGENTSAEEKKQL